MATIIEQANAWATARNYTAWTGADVSKQSAALVRAGDYIAAHYPNLKTTMTDQELLKFNAALFIIAYDKLSEDKPTFQADKRVVEEEDEIEGIREKKKYADVDYDPYPLATGLLAGLVVKTQTGRVFNTGRMRL